jgi:hypothetical protein
MSCITQEAVFDPTYSGEILSFDVDGNSVTISSDIPLEEDESVNLLEITTESPPIFMLWNVNSISGLIAFGLSIEGSEGVIGDDLINFYYLSDGRFVVNGSVVDSGPAITNGDVVGMYYDFQTGSGNFFLNGIRVL